MAPKANRSAESELPELLRKPMLLDAGLSGSEFDEEWRRRWLALFDFLNVDPNTSDAYRRLAEKLATRFIPGLGPRSRRKPAKKQGKVGRPRIFEDSTLLIENVDRLTLRKKNAFEACKALSRMPYLPAPQSDIRNPCNGKSAKILVNQYYKHAQKVRGTLRYFTSYPEYFCAQKATHACFAVADFDECDIDKLSDLCRKQQNCPFRTRVEVHLLQLSRSPSIAALIKIRKNACKVAGRSSARRAEALKSLQQENLRRRKK